MMMMMMMMMMSCIVVQVVRDAWRLAAGIHMAQKGCLELLGPVSSKKCHSERDVFVCACALIDFHLKDFGLRRECREAAARVVHCPQQPWLQNVAARIRNFVQLWLARFFVAQRYGRGPQRGLRRGTDSHLFGCEIGGFAFDDTA